jgi:endonuclease YncB( thermonuclease family)
MDPTGTRPDLPKGLPDPRGGLPERTVAREINIGEEMVRQGLAWADVRQAGSARSLVTLQDEARAAKRGLWARANPTPPWAATSATSARRRR